MAESLNFNQNSSREERYLALYPQVQAILDGESDLIANLANFVAVLREGFGFFWIGFYLVKNEELVLGPFQGPIACTRIPFSKGVCGFAATTRKTVVVPDVDQFPGHIACSSAAKSEIVVPVFNSNGVLRAVLDVDSDKLSDFSDLDQMHLEKWVRLLEKKF